MRIHPVRFTASYTSQNLATLRAKQPSLGNSVFPFPASFPYKKPTFVQALEAVEPAHFRAILDVGYGIGYQDGFRNAETEERDQLWSQGS